MISIRPRAALCCRPIMLHSRRRPVGGTLRSKSTSASKDDAGWIAWYSSKLDTHPLLTMSISSGMLAGGGDVLCQTCIERVGTYDWARTGRFTLLGTFVVAPFVHGWYSFLNRVIPGASVVAVAKRVAVDQFVFSPCFLSVSFSQPFSAMNDERLPRPVVFAMDLF